MLHIPQSEGASSPSQRSDMWRQITRRISMLIPSPKANHGVVFKNKHKTPFITFVLGPGSGKGTQCGKLVDAFGFHHLSAGDLLRKEISSGSVNGAEILDIIKQGSIVPSEITVNLIRNAMELSGSWSRFLIDGFPRTEENRAAFESIMGVEPDVVLFFDCPELDMVKRVLSRNEGRVDDNIDTVRKRLEVFKSLNLPVLDYYSKKGKLCKIDAVGSADHVFKRVRSVLSSYIELL